MESKTIKIKRVKKKKSQRWKGEVFQKKAVSDSLWYRNQWSTWELWRFCHQGETEVFLHPFWEDFITPYVPPPMEEIRGATSTSVLAPVDLQVFPSYKLGSQQAAGGRSVGLRSLLKSWSLCLSIKPLAGKVEAFCHGPCEYRPASSRYGKRGNAVQIVTYQSAWDSVWTLCV